MSDDRELDPTADLPSGPILGAGGGVAEPGVLYLVATPIGNLADITYRAVSLLSSVSRIACEDTRHCRKLLLAYRIRGRLLTYHDHNKEASAPGILKLLQAGESVALVTDAGTPGVSDPGYYLVRMALEAGVRVVPVPGPSAFLTALSVSGLPTDRFRFEGFLPDRQTRRKKRLQELADGSQTLLFYEAPHRLIAALTDVRSVLGDRAAVACRELTKLHEEVVRGTITDLIDRFTDKPPRGEVVLVVAGAPEGEPPETEEDQARLMAEVAMLVSAGKSRSDAVQEVAEKHGVKRQELYRELGQE